MPIRLQRKRTKGSRLPDGCVVVTRGTKYGNPFRIGGHFKKGGGGVPRLGLTFIYFEALEGYQDATYATIASAAESVQWYRWYMSQMSPQWHAKMREDLAGKDLACWCRPESPCHADVLLALANSAIPSSTDRTT